MNFPESYWVSLVFCFFAAAALYASVGHGGASAYLALMALAGFATGEMKPVALILNIVVSGLALATFVRSGHFRMRLFLPLALASVPAAFVGGWIQASSPVFRIILGGALLAGAVRLLPRFKETPEHQREPHHATLSALGIVIGFLSGLVGIGGGIFLTPILILCRWSSARTAAGVSAAFILANSLSGVSGHILKGGQVPSVTWALLPAVVAGGVIGSVWGARRATMPALRYSLAVVLLVAATKLTII